MVAEFIIGFEEKITAVPIYERKELVKKVISRIVVDREAGVARCYVRRVPAVTSDLQNLYSRIEKNETPHKEAFRTKPVAGTQTFDFAELHQVFELSY